MLYYYLLRKIRVHVKTKLHYKSGNYSHEKEIHFGKHNNLLLEHRTLHNMLQICHKSELINVFPFLYLIL